MKLDASIGATFEEQFGDLEKTACLITTHYSTLAQGWSKGWVLGCVIQDHCFLYPRGGASLRKLGPIILVNFIIYVTKCGLNLVI